jgi:ABC-type multidrug transport system fused ATPase/permease subunit
MSETLKNSLDLKYLETYFYDSAIEEDFDTPKAPHNWPTEGAIELQNISVRYSPEASLVLKNLSFIAEPKCKIGIIGRTGAGKSTLLSALTRIIELG